MLKCVHGGIHFTPYGCLSRAEVPSLGHLTGMRCALKDLLEASWYLKPVLLEWGLSCCTVGMHYDLILVLTNASKLGQAGEFQAPSLECT